MKNALVLFAQGSEELEAVTVVNILRRAGINVTLAGTDEGALKGSRGIAIQPDATLDSVLHRNFDLIVLPGGQPGTRNLKADPRVLQLVRSMAESGKLVAAICAAPMVLAAAGLLDDKEATCFPGSCDDYPKVLLRTCAIVEDGNLVTSRGPGTAMDFALLLAERLAGKAVREKVEAGLVR